MFNLKVENEDLQRGRGSISALFHSCVLISHFNEELYLYEVTLHSHRATEEEEEEVYSTIVSGC